MRPLGQRKTPTKVAGHQDCGDCHPDTTKGGEARARRWWDDPEARKAYLLARWDGLLRRLSGSPSSDTEAGR
jgi:hypothetical protein